MLTSSEQTKTIPIPASNSFLQKKESNHHASKQSPFSFIQPKLTVGAPDDIYEKEADAMADKVMRMPMPEPISFSTSSNLISRTCSHFEKEKELHRKESNSDTTTIAPSIVHQVLNSSGGKSLDPETRSFMEPRFNYDFSHVKIHDNDLAAKSASSINALAYTSGNNIVFNSGQYNPSSDHGKKLLAHELMHTLQQKNNEPRISRSVPSGCVKDTSWGILKPSAGTDANVSWDKLIGKPVHKSKGPVPEAIKSADEAVRLFRKTSSGQWLITELDKTFSGKGCTGTVIYLEFVDDTSFGGATDGYATSDRRGLRPCDLTGAYYVQVKYKVPTSPTEPNSDFGLISEMTDTIQHELGHVWFVNVYGKRIGSSRDYTTGHGNLDVNPSDLEPEFCRILYSMNDELYVLREEARKQAEQARAAELKRQKGSLDYTPDIDGPLRPSRSFLSLLGVQGVVHGGKSYEGPWLGMVDLQLVLGKASSFHVGPRLIFPDARKVFPGLVVGGRIISDSPLFFDLDVGVVFQGDKSNVSVFLGGSMGHEFGKSGLRPFIEVSGWAIINDDIGRGGALTVGGGVRY